ncbi:unnamed protein product [Caenorhabditis angaria]|uniref:Secreted protein n=1 Tax=Caenorhabditis angaria TaxID=860376 RepID=A0A9P1IEC6_9PELO|nr:unnamed protein product [Caenorhabditis angaria]
MLKITAFFLLIMILLSSNQILCSDDTSTQKFLAKFQEHLKRGFRVAISAKFARGFYMHSGNITYNRDQIVHFLMDKKRNFEEISIFNSTSRTEGESQHLVYLKVVPKNGKNRFFEIYLTLLRFADYYILGGNEIFN